jgi:hypothetical protein
VGKDEDKYLDAQTGVEGGWKVYTVKTVDMERNRLYINDYSVRLFKLSRRKTMGPVEEDLPERSIEVVVDMGYWIRVWRATREHCR